MHTLRQGSRAPEVRLLQRLVNQYLFTRRGVPVLDEDGVFGPATAAGLRSFQENYSGRHGRLDVDAVAGHQTWRALGLTHEIAWPVAQVGQNTGMTCWVVAAGLATGRMASEAPATVSIDTDRSSSGFGGMDNNVPNLDAYARANGMRRLGTLPADVAALRPHVQSGPCIMIGDWVLGGTHAVVVSGLYWSTDFASMIRVNDSAPMGTGSISISDYPNVELRSGSFTPTDMIVR